MTVFRTTTTLTAPQPLSYPSHLASCAQILSFLNASSLPDGVYWMDLAGRQTQAYCQFDAENAFAWTLVESFAMLFASSLYSLSFNLGINARSPQQRHSVYRLPLLEMQALQAVSSHNLVTCDWDASLSRASDLVLLDTARDGWHLLSKTGAICRSVTRVRIRGHECANGSAPFWTLANHFHIDSSYAADECSCHAWRDTALRNEDNFGQYY